MQQLVSAKDTAAYGPVRPNDGDSVGNRLAGGYLHRNLAGDTGTLFAADWKTTPRDVFQSRDVSSNEARDPSQGTFLHDKKQQRDVDMLDAQHDHPLRFLEPLAPDVVRGWQWLEQNQSQFGKEIFGPPMVTCSIKDRGYCSLVQSFLQDEDVQCFTAQSANDHKKLSDQFDIMGLSVTIRMCKTPLSSFQHVSTKELAAMGFEGLAIDYLEGPDPVLAMLCAEQQLHRRPVSLEDVQQDQVYKAMAAGRISAWATKDQIFRVHRRPEYGAEAISTSVCGIRPGQYWTNISQTTGLQQGSEEL